MDISLKEIYKLAISRRKGYSKQNQMEIKITMRLYHTYWDGYQEKKKKTSVDVESRTNKMALV